MASASRYWQLVQVDGSGKLRTDALLEAQAFFEQRFEVSTEQAELADTQIQRELLSLLRGEASTQSSDRSLAEQCLRCYISQQIVQVCTRLTSKYAKQGVQREEMLHLVLGDVVRQFSTGQFVPTSARSLATEILQTFDPSQAGLNTWVFRQVRHHREFNRFLREHGVYLIGDWAILNDTRPEQLQRILSQFHMLAAAEIQEASLLLDAYHAVYREDRWQQRRSGAIRGREECRRPTEEQLTRIAQFFGETANLSWSNQKILSKLQFLATKLREHRVHVRRKTLPAQALYQDRTLELRTDVQAPEEDAASEQAEFLKFYRDQFLECLDQAIELAISDRLTYLRRKDPEAAERFLIALDLFHCQGQSMGKIAPQIGLKAQFQVSRLMKLDEFRASVRQKMLKLLSDRILDQAKLYADPDYLLNLDHQIETALDEQIEQLIKEAADQAAVGKRDCPLTGLFARRLCQQLCQQLNITVS